MHTHPIAVALAAALTPLPAPALAGGSISWEEARPLLEQGDPTSLELLEDKFEIAPAGAAVRLGNHFQKLGGLRIPPFSFTLTHIDTATPYQLTLHANISFIRDARPILDPDDPSALLAEDVALSYRSFELAIAPLPAIASPLPRPQLSPEQVRDHRALIRDVVRDTDLARNASELRRTTIAFGSPPEQGILEIYHANKDDAHPTFLSLHRPFSDHDSESWIIYLHKGSPIFALHQSHSWAFSTTTQGQTIDSFHESRFYLSGGAVYNLLEKSYEGTGQQEIEKNRNAAVNTTIDLSTTSTIQVETLLARLASARQASDIQAAIEAEPGELWTPPNQ
jgi:hypothetical protein